MLRNLSIAILLTLSANVFAGECVMTFAALSHFDDDFETSFYDRKNQQKFSVQNANECVIKASESLGKKRKFQSENRFVKRDEIRTIAIVNYTFTEDDMSLKGKVELTRTPSSFF